MLTAKDVAGALIRANNSGKSTLTGNTMLQKILFYTQAWNLAWFGRPLYDDQIAAWKMGPVVPAVWGEIKHEKVVTSTRVPEGHDAAVIDSVSAYYRRFHGSQLINMTHAEDPWKHAYYDENGLPRQGQPVISQSDMRKFYAKQAILGKPGPKKPAVTSPVEASPEASGLIARAQTRRWDEALRLLAEC